MYVLDALGCSQVPQRQHRVFQALLCPHYSSESARFSYSIIHCKLTSLEYYVVWILFLIRIKSAAGEKLLIRL